MLLQMQEQWQKKRRTRFIGKSLMGSSIAPIVVGAIFTSCLIAQNRTNNTLPAVEQTMTSAVIAAEAGKIIANDVSANAQDIKNETYSSITAALEFDENGLNWRRDWWKVSLAALVAVLTLLLLLHAARIILKFVSLLICAILALIGAFFLQGITLPYIQEYAPQSLTNFISAEYLALFLLFIVCFCIVSIIALAMLNVMHALQKTSNANDETGNAK